MNGFELKYKKYGERSILIEWPANIDSKILLDITVYKNKLEKELHKKTIEIKFAYNSILISYNNFIIDFDKTISNLKSIYDLRPFQLNQPQRVWKIPVCYDEVFGLDLSMLSKITKLDKQKIITLHTETIYTVYFIGFLPGFLYLGGLHDAIHFPRQESPRLHIEKGSVGIGGNQTGIYPCKSPGGWNIIGNSPINFFDSTKEVPCFASPGDRIKFDPISHKEYLDLKALIDSGKYKLESNVFHD